MVARAATMTSWVVARWAGQDVPVSAAGAHICANVVVPAKPCAPITANNGGYGPVTGSGSRRHVTVPGVVAGCSDG